MQALSGRFAIGFVCVLLSAGLSFGQVEISGRIAGIVTDPSGARIPGVEVTVSGPTLFTPRTTLTTEDASYFIDKLPVGNYNVTFAFPGFKTVERNNVNIRANFTATINVTMEVGAIEETLLVVEAAPVVDVTTATQATTFDAGLLAEIPTGRDTWSTLATVPGLTPSKFDIGGTESFQQTGTSVHGSSGQTAYNVNGLNLNWPGGSGSATAFYFDNDGFEEVQVVTDAAQAETLVGGVQINMVSKQGSNAVRGQILGYYTTSKLASNPNYPTFNSQTVEAGTKITMMRDTNVQMGFPIIRDRLWWFSGYRRYDINLAVPAVKRPDGSAIKDNNHQSNLNARLDIAITNRQRLSLNWLYNSINRFFRGSTGLTDDVATGRQIEPAWIGQAQWTYAPTNNLVLESRFGNMTLHFSQGYQPEVKPGTIAVTDSVLGTVKYARPGGSTLNHTYHARGTQNVSYFKSRWLGGNHNIRTGFEYARLSNGNRVFVNRDITIVVANGVPLRANLLNTPRRSRERVNETAGFIQDSIVVGRMTINGGLRYDRFLAFLPPQRSEAGTWVGERRYQRSENLVTFNDLSPRISMAFDVAGDGRSVVRASFSRFVDLQGSSLVSQFNPNASSTIQVPITALGPDNYPLDDLTSLRPSFVEGGQFRT
ncbi:MAG: TonB-dependent receptor, partial [Acidobacteria bacterium]|nr:TonB-dependent receptor [Acidobacteriota bacterium]